MLTKEQKTELILCVSHSSLFSKQMYKVEKMLEKKESLLIVVNEMLHVGMIMDLPMNVVRARIHMWTDVFYGPISDDEINDIIQEIHKLNLQMQEVLKWEDNDNENK